MIGYSKLLIFSFILLFVDVFYCFIEFVNIFELL